jgi:tetratricopeptide (TPR) repeat protein
MSCIMQRLGWESPEDALAALAGAAEARSNPAEAAKAIVKALALAPDDLEISLAAYRFYFYSHRYADALPHAEFILAYVARRLNIAGDWHAVGPADAPFDAIETAPGLYLQALTAWGYCMLRLGAGEDGRAALEKAAELDAKGRFGARILLAAVDGQED